MSDEQIPDDVVIGDVERFIPQTVNKLEEEIHQLKQELKLAEVRAKAAEILLKQNSPEAIVYQILNSLEAEAKENWDGKTLTCIRKIREKMNELSD